MAKEMNFCLTSVCLSMVFLFHVVQAIDNKCGIIKDNNGPLILNGATVRRGAWPFIAAIFEKTMGYQCGGTVLSRKHVLTAAHCIALRWVLETYRAEDISVRLGAHNLTAKNEAGAENKQVSKIYVHPEWNKWEDTFDADAAILVLSVDVAFTLYIQPICLPTDDDISMNGAVGHIVGWGYLETETNEGLPREGVTTALNDSYCFQAANILAQLSSFRTFCAGNGVAVPTKGDSGGGYFIVSQSRWVQYGIISVMQLNETGHASAESLTLLTNVKLLKSWITEITEWQVFDCLFEYIENSYSCRLLRVRFESDRLPGNVRSHLLGKTDNDVEAIYISSLRTFLLGSRIEETFRNMTKLEFVDSLDNLFKSKFYFSPEHFQDMDNLAELKLDLTNGRIVERVFEPKLFLSSELYLTNGIVEKDKSFDVNFLDKLPNLKNFSLKIDQRSVLHDTTFHSNFKIREVHLDSVHPEFIPNNLFKNNSFLENVDLNFYRGFLDEYIRPIYLPSDLFENNLSLETVKITSGFYLINEQIFETNAKLRKVELILAQLHYLPWNLFTNNSCLENVSLFAISEIDGRIFETNEKLKVVNLESSLRHLPFNLFRNNFELEKVSFKFNHITELDCRTFDTNEKLREVELTLFQLDFLPWNLFKNNFELEKVQIVSNLNTTEERFFETNDKLKEVYIESTRFMHWNLFKNNILLENVFIISSVTTIDERFFETNEKLKEVKLKSQIRLVPWNLFKNNKFLEAVTLVYAISEVDARTFETNTELKKVTLQNIYSNERDFEPRYLFLPKNLFRNNLLLETVHITSRLKTIDAHFFETNAKLKNVILERNRLEFLPSDLFKNNLALEDINLSGNELKIIGVDFSALKNIKNINLHGNVCTYSKWPDYYDKTLNEFQHKIRYFCSSRAENSAEKVFTYTAFSVFICCLTTFAL